MGLAATEGTIAYDKVYIIHKSIQNGLLTTIHHFSARCTCAELQVFPCMLAVILPQCRPVLDKDERDWYEGDADECQRTACPVHTKLGVHGVSEERETSTEA